MSTLTLHHVTNNDVTTEYNRFQDIAFDLETQTEILKEKQSRIDAGYLGGELKTVWMMESWSAADSLKRVENQLMGDRDELHKLDQSIVLLYMKILAYQASKVHFLVKRLEALRNKDGCQSCPIDYTVTSYQEWTRTNPKIHAMQSEVLELLSRKIKYRTRAMEQENIKTFSLNDFAGSKMEKLRSQTLFFLERDPLVDADFSLHVSSVVRIEANTFEAERMRRFVNFCWDHKYSEDLGQTYQEFVGALVEHIMNKFGYMRRSGQSKNELSRDQIFAIIEGHLIPHIYDCLQKHHPDDIIMQQRYHEMKAKSQLQLGVTSQYVDPSLFPYHDAVLKLRELSLLRLPTQKLRAIILASQCVMKKMNELCRNTDLVVGADEFIDVWVYVTIQAGVENLCWDIHYLKEFSNPNYMLSETGYYLSSLEMAAEYIKTISLESLDGGLRDDEERTLFLADTRAVRRLCESKCSPFLLLDEVTLKGYLFATLPNMILDTSRLIRCAIELTSCNGHEIKLLRIKVSSGYDENTVRRYLQLDRYSNEVALKDCGNGKAPYLTKEPSTQTTVFRFQNLQESWPHLRNYMTLKMLDFSFERSLFGCVHASMLKGENETCFKKNYLMGLFGYNEEEDDLTSLLKKIVLDIQERLRHLKLYSELLPLDGLCSLLLQHSVQCFQKQQKSISRQDGVCDQLTYDMLKKLTS